MLVVHMTQNVADVKNGGGVPGDGFVDVVTAICGLAGTFIVDCDRAPEPGDRAPEPGDRAPSGSSDGWNPRFLARKQNHTQRRAVVGALGSLVCAALRGNRSGGNDHNDHNSYRDDHN